MNYVHITIILVVCPYIIIIEKYQQLTVNSVHLINIRFFLIFKKIYPRILCFYHMQKRCHWRALQVYFYVVDGTRLISSCIFHNDLVCKCNIFKYSFFFRQIRVVLIKWFSYSSQTVSISILLRYSHHQIFVFIGKKKLILLRRHKIILKY